MTLNKFKSWRITLSLIHQNYHQFTGLESKCIKNLQLMNVT